MKTHEWIISILFWLGFVAFVYAIIAFR